MANKKENTKKRKNTNSRLELKKNGRPSKFTDELAERIIKAVATSPRGIKKICDDNPDFPTPETIRMWRYENKIFSAKYAQAKMEQADILAEECVDIADDDSQDLKITENGVTFNGEFAQRSRIRIDTRKWLASKLIPKLYGDLHEFDKTKQENEDLKNEIRELRLKLDEQNRRDY